MNLVTTLPNVAFSLKIQIDSVKQVRKLNDYSRKLAVQLSWISQITGWISSVINFLQQDEDESDRKSYQIFTRPQVKSYGFVKSFVNQVTNLIRNHVLMANHIVGLLSSSYQGGTLNGGKRKEVIEKELLMSKRLQ